MLHHVAKTSRGLETTEMPSGSGEVQVSQLYYCINSMLTKIYNFTRSLGSRPEKYQPIISNRNLKIHQ